MKINKVSIYSETLYNDVVRLLPQLDPGIKPPSKEYFREILSSGSITLFTANSDDGQMAGMLTLVSYPNITGRKLWIEDVVVDTSFRGQGIGELLTREAILHSGTLGAREIKLTSRPFRVAANALYQKMGFVKYDTNVYKFELG